MSQRVINRPGAGSAVGVDLLGSGGSISVKVPHHPSEPSFHAYPGLRVYVIPARFQAIVHDTGSQFIPTAASLTKSYSHSSITQACPSCTAFAAACALTTVICCAQGRLQLTLVHCLERAGHIPSRIKRTHRFRNCTAMPASVRTSRCAPGRTLCDYSTIGRRPLQAHLHHG